MRFSLAFGPPLFVAVLVSLLTLSATATAELSGTPLRDYNEAIDPYTEVYGEDLSIDPYADVYGDDFYDTDYREDATQFRIRQLPDRG